MEFEGQYLTYNEYKQLGGTLDQTPFNLSEFECRRLVDERTQNRLKNFDGDIPQEVKLCIFKMINSIEKFLEISNNSSNVEKETIDGYSISYITPDKLTEIIKSKNTEFNDIITTYLFGVIINDEHLIFLGIN